MSFFIYVGLFSYVSVSLHICRSLFTRIPANQDAVSTGRFSYIHVPYIYICWSLFISTCVFLYAHLPIEAGLKWRYLAWCAHFATYRLPFEFHSKAAF